MKSVIYKEVILWEKGTLDGIRYGYQRIQEAFGTRRTMITLRAS